MVCVCAVGNLIPHALRVPPRQLGQITGKAYQARANMPTNLHEMAQYLSVLFIASGRNALIDHRGLVTQFAAKAQVSLDCSARIVLTLQAEEEMVGSKDRRKSKRRTSQELWSSNLFHQLTVKATRVHRMRCQQRTARLLAALQGLKPQVSKRMQSGALSIVDEERSALHTTALQQISAAAEGNSVRSAVETVQVWFYTVL